MTSGVRWYSVNQDLTVEDRGDLDVDTAIDIVGRYFVKSRSHYDSGEEAFAATTFGFARSKDDFIELCIHTPERISLRTEPLPAASRGLLQRLARRNTGEITLGSREETEQRVRDYFRDTSEDFRARLATDYAL